MFDLCETDLAQEDFRSRYAPGSGDYPSALRAVLDTLSEAELEELEDELNFYAFSGIQGARVRQLMIYL